MHDLHDLRDVHGIHPRVQFYDLFSVHVTGFFAIVFATVRTFVLRVHFSPRHSPFITGTVAQSKTTASPICLKVFINSTPFIIIMFDKLPETSHVMFYLTMLTSICYE